MSVSIHDIRAAARRLAGHVRQTPILSSPALDAIAGRRVLVKAENLQETGSFKARGAWAAISQLSDIQKELGVIAYSSGNHAQGVARAARAHQCPATIIMPKDAPAAKIQGTQDLGAQVVLYDRATEDRDALGDRLAAERELTLIKPFDDADVIAGQGTVGLEIANAARGLAIEDTEVLVPVGGGGLLSGIAVALEHDAPGMRARPVEPERFDDVARSLVSGTQERNAQRSGSICDAILTPSPGDLTFPLIKRLCRPGLVVSEEDCLRAMALAFRHLKVVIEPGGAVALAAALFHPDQIRGDSVVVVASGGNVDAKIFTRALEYLDQ
ncbi:threonine/serine dehydratase [Aliiroseovarius crassostreae]|uniref:threonine ammonia-lyase n=1 Tax=Aliiroseovarius crassostreae TaxID=154981 RepID=UPI00220557F3|nr:threonine/serine dehydratase [Aliiroseovarius crassostreae]UWQ04216.1 threonine/serine dehydratase [Aliiroseovarius crassostreae]